MPLLLAGYMLLSWVVCLVVFPFAYLIIRHKSPQPLMTRHRLGCYPKPVVDRIRRFRYRVWIHAASVGEVGVALAIAKALADRRPEAGLVLSTTTWQGYQAALRAAPENMVPIIAPLDIFFAIRSAVNRIRPHVMAFVETEIWPCWLSQVHRRRVPVAFLNGRLSERSAAGYRRLRPVLRPLFEGVDAFSMVRRADAERMVRAGAPAARVWVGGNAKFDRIRRLPDPGALVDLRARYAVAEGDPVWVAGSIRSGEMASVMSAYEEVIRAVPACRLVIAPRHLERVDMMVGRCRDMGFKCIRRSRLDDLSPGAETPVVILDTMGELGHTYGLATVVFVGGSLVPKGGQNLLEAAAWGKPVCYGPSMNDFIEETALVEGSGAGTMVMDAQELAHHVIDCLRHPDDASRRGDAGRQAVLVAAGAADCHAAVVQWLLERSGG